MINILWYANICIEIMKGKRGMYSIGQKNRFTLEKQELFNIDIEGLIY